MRCSTRLTARISPDKPISPAKQVLNGTGISSCDEIMAAASPRSIAGSSTRMPPVIFRNTSLAPNLKPQRFSRTASSMLMRLVSKPVAVRWGVPYGESLTRACVSIIMGRRPSKVVEMVMPLKGSSRWESNISDGFDTSRSPSPSIS